jgi:aminopeptidase N
MVAQIHRYPQNRRSLFPCVSLALAVLALLVLLTACGRNRAPQPSLDRYRPAMKPETESQLDALVFAPRYDIDVTFDPAENLLTGRATIVLYNTTPDPWRSLLFRLYPALKQYGGGMIIQGAAVNGRPAAFDYVADTVLRVNLTQALAEGERADVQLAWQLRIPQWSDSTGVYALFGTSQQITSLPLFYPSLAVYQPGPTLGTGRWWTETGTVLGDAAFNYASFFAVTATLPADQIPVTSGTLISSTLIGNGQARHVWVTGPSREFLLQISPILRSVYTETYGTRVTSYWLPGHEAAGRQALTYAIAALRIYSDRFGPYPYRDLRVAPAPLSFRGMEYPQAILLGTELYSQYRDNLEVLIAHEVAHQWWYLIVHNDPVNEPWLDEAVAEYSMKIYLEELRGKRGADQLLWDRWQTPWNGLRAKGEDTLLNQGVDSFRNGTQYETVVYGKGALFLEALREQLGDRGFFRFLHRYLEQHRYGLVDSATWQADLMALQNPAVDALFQEWVTQPVAGQDSGALIANQPADSP